MTGTFLNANPVFTPAPSAVVNGNDPSGSGTSTSRSDGGLDFTGSGSDFAFNGTDAFTFSYSGTGNGTVTPGIYISYNFTDLVRTSDPGYSLSFTIDGMTTTHTGSVAGDGSTTTGTFNLSYTPGITLTNWSAVFSFDDPPASQLLVTYNPISVIIPSAVAPEPASLLLALAGLGPVVYFRRRRSRREAVRG